MAMASRADCCANMLLQALALLLTNGGDSSCSELQSDQLHHSPALPAFTIHGTRVLLNRAAQYV
jgi:hypothetical protein